MNDKNFITIKLEREFVWKCFIFKAINKAKFVELFYFNFTNNFLGNFF